ncbi:hypothetical protein MLD38_036463 [Melastoma candidum]|uniref:Uncharacterized protein n=1 Tax=Melastoma candidum TaxID=119954 RepID=A0ACB9LJS1_9MYRT|nr:hypothetical protein MLD38_036463 [Melastoma candidum]
MALSHNVIGAINFFAVILSIPIIGAGIWLMTQSDNSCVKILQWPLIILGVLILVVSLAGFIGGICRIQWLLVSYLVAMLGLIVILSCLVGLIFTVTSRGHGHPEPYRAYLEYSLEDFSGWMVRRVRSPIKWDRIRGCLAAAGMCNELEQRFRMAQDFFNARITPLQSGCCKPPTKCGYQFINPTYWISPIDMNADYDCLQWSNDQNQLCYGCDSCKAGLLASLRTEWRRANVVLTITLVGLVCVYVIGCCAFRSAKTEDLFRRYKQGYT